jgi:hypothetical protein
LIPPFPGSNPGAPASQRGPAESDMLRHAFAGRPASHLTRRRFSQIENADYRLPNYVFGNMRSGVRSACRWGASLGLNDSSISQRTQ